MLSMCSVQRVQRVNCDAVSCLMQVQVGGFFVLFCFVCFYFVITINIAFGLVTMIYIKVEVLVF